MFPLFEEDAFVQISCLLVVSALEMHACQRKLVFNVRRKTLMIVHELRFVPNVMRNMKQDSILEMSWRTLEGCFLSLLVHAKSELAECYPQPHGWLRISIMNKVQIKLLLRHMKIADMREAVCTPEPVFSH